MDRPELVFLIIAPPYIIEVLLRSNEPDRAKEVRELAELAYLKSKYETKNEE